MKTALEFYGEIDSKDWIALQAIRGWLDGLPDKGNPDRAGSHLWSCHAVCRAALRHFAMEKDGWRVEDGYFARAAYDHSWLIRRKGEPGETDYCRTILDVYPFASAGGPLMVSAASWNTPWQQLYVIDTFRPDRYKDRLVGFDADAEVLVAISAAKEGRMRL